MSTNIAQTVWSPNDGRGEYSLTTPQLLADPQVITSVIADPQVVTSFLSDTGVILTAEPATLWAEDDSRA